MVGEPGREPPDVPRDGRADGPLLPAPARGGRVGDSESGSGPLTRILVSLVVAAFCALTSAAAHAQDPTHRWSSSVSGAFYLLPDDANFLQPTVRADRGHLHLEARYNYEDRGSASFFFGANFETGNALTLSVTPMLGALVGRTSGVIPAMELTLGWKRLEAYAEAEYVLVSGGDDEDYFYMWSELGLWTTDWLRAGGVAQRTRVHHQDRDVQPGLLAGGRRGRVDGTVYLFSPARDDAYTVLSVAVSF